MCIKTILFDLDDTLYPSNCGLWDVLSERMSTFMREKLHIPDDQIYPLRIQYYTEYGTTLKGLEKFHQVVPEEYLGYVHDIDIGAFIQPDPDLRVLLNQIEFEKVILTNANCDHAYRVTQALGITDCFSRVIDILQMEPHCKPQQEAFIKTMQLLGETDPSSYLLIDDNLKNVQTARKVGLHTIMVHDLGDLPNDMPAIRSIHELPNIWNIKTGEFNV